MESNTKKEKKRPGQDCFFWGITGQALVLSDFLSDFNCRLRWLFDNNPKAIPSISGIPVFYGKEAFKNWAQKHQGKGIPFLVAIGGDKGCDRVNIQNEISNAGFRPLTVWHKTAFVSGSSNVGEGSQILANSAVCAGARLGKACIVNTGAQVDHECILGDGVHIMPGAILAGCVTVGDYATIGSGAVVLPRIKIGSGAFVGAGAVVTKDVAPNTVVVGIPAHIRRRITG